MATRLVLPAAVMAVIVGLLALSLRSVLTPTVPVRVTPVVAAPPEAGNDHGQPEEASTAGREAIVQAPGWVEAEPYAVSIAALVEGVVKDVLVLEGDRVAAGQVVARLVDDEYRLALAGAEAALREAQAAVAQATADQRSAAARLAEEQDQLARKEPLLEAGGVSEGELARTRLRVASLEREVESARAAVMSAEAAAARQEVAVRQAQLDLERTEIRASVAGVVLSRSIEPGIRISFAGPGPGESHEAGIMRLYDPARLQVRADIALADAAKIGTGMAAEVTTEALPGVTMLGSVSRLSHEANIQRNTVQVKVRINDPPPALRPEMLARVRFFGGATATGAPDITSERLLLASSAVLEQSGTSGTAWIVEAGSGGATAARRTLTLAGTTPDGHTIVTGGVRAGERAILDAPATLQDGDRVRIVGEDSARGGG